MEQVLMSFIYIPVTKASNLLEFHVFYHRVAFVKLPK